MRRQQVEELQTYQEREDVRTLKNSSRKSWQMSSYVASLEFPESSNADRYRQTVLASFRKVMLE